MAVALRDGDGAMTRNSCQREGITASFGKPGQSGVPHCIGREACDWILHALSFGLLFDHFQSLSVMSLRGIAV